MWNLNGKGPKLTVLDVQEPKIFFVGKKKKKTLFLWMVFNCLKARATSRRQFAFYH